MNIFLSIILEKNIEPYEDLNFLLQLVFQNLIKMLSANEKIFGHPTLVDAKERLKAGKPLISAAERAKKDEGPKQKTEAQIQQEEDDMKLSIALGQHETQDDIDVVEFCQGVTECHGVSSCKRGPPS